MDTFQSQALNVLLQDELAAGNRIDDQGPGWGNMNRLVILRFPFRTVESTLPVGLSLNEVNDPHYWKAELVDEATREMVACRFG